ncbi:flagellar hook-length control protein FliK [Arthrobacter sp. AL08]|uniref:flagellar hook-length control protein FliK n=1 Tax=Micrococcaceae TaxID=1268 RepID=UPI00249B75B4|nr:MULTISPECIES: flagellar hook-length control protein FliK [Micrococcaceae]MDI3242943.1 flagellar hook-length control protein FliK [Arthrobacter sp. AL05]MDI3278987.1 flagellar hook-length control protein FliK [Arthrobacter sp. AL08]MDJ0353350.1 flagellar hook-length control protein FliK [Pseudarthrobacter sp. PH31-O2]
MTASMGLGSAAGISRATQQGAGGRAGTTTSGGGAFGVLLDSAVSSNAQPSNAQPSNAQPSNVQPERPTSETTVSADSNSAGSPGVGAPQAVPARATAAVSTSAAVTTSASVTAQLSGGQPDDTKVNDATSQDASPSKDDAAGDVLPVPAWFGTALAAPAAQSTAAAAGQAIPGRMTPEQAATEPQLRAGGAVPVSAPATAVPAAAAGAPAVAADANAVATGAPAAVVLPAATVAPSSPAQDAAPAAGLTGAASTPATASLQPHPPAASTTPGLSSAAGGTTFAGLVPNAGASGSDVRPDRKSALAATVSVESASTAGAAALTGGPATPTPTAATSTSAPQAPATASPQQGPALQPQLSRPLFTLAAAAAGEHVMTLKVNPEDLGPLTIRAHIDAGGVRIEMFSPGEAGREALRGVLPELRKELADAGFGASLNLSDRSGPGDGGRNGRPGHQNDAAAQRSAPRRNEGFHEPAPRIPGRLGSPQTNIDILV